MKKRVSSKTLYCKKKKKRASENKKNKQKKVNAKCEEEE